MNTHETCSGCSHTFHRDDMKFYGGRWWCANDEAAPLSCYTQIGRDLADLEARASAQQRAIYDEQQRLMPRKVGRAHEL